VHEGGRSQGDSDLPRIFFLVHFFPSRGFRSGSDARSRAPRRRMKAGGTRRVVVEIQFPVYAGRRCFWENNCQPMRWQAKRKVSGYLPGCFTAAPPVENADCMKDRRFVRLPIHFQESPRHSLGKHEHAANVIVKARATATSATSANIH